MKRIIVVDDNQLSLKRSEALLQPLGFEVICFTGAEPALQLLKMHAVNLLLLDLSMPVHSGYDLMAALNKEGLKVRTVVVSGKNRDEDIRKALALGAQDYILKPFDDDFFVGKVKMALAKDLGSEDKSGFAEAVDDRASTVSLKIPQIVVSEMGFHFDSTFRFERGMSLNFDALCFQEMKLDGVRLNVTTCTEVRPGPDSLYRTFVSFVGLTQAQLTDVRLWVRSQQLKFKKS